MDTLQAQAADPVAVINRYKYNKSLHAFLEKYTITFYLTTFSICYRFQMFFHNMKARIVINILDLNEATVCNCISLKKLKIGKFVFYFD